jgi:trimeric autotransporter adhesin
MRFLAGLVVCLPLSSLWAQQYVISTVAGGAPAPASAAAINVALGQPGRVALDPSGNVYFTALNSVYRVDSTGNAIRIAGNGRAGFSGDNGPALNAQLNSPQGLAIDTAGDVYICDTGNERLRLVSNGIITTIAGTGVPGSAGDYGDPTQAQLHLPVAVALDIYNNPYIADSANNVIRTIQDGIIFPFAGNYIPGYSNDNESALVAALYGPTDVIFDIHENMFIADSLNGRIREVSGGIITSVVGPVTGVPPNYIEGGSATETLLSSPRSVAVDTAGNIYIADSDANRIRKVILTKGIITTYVGSGNPGFSGDGGPALNAQINTPSNIAVDFSGNLYFVDFANARVRKVNVSGTISTVVGNGVGRYSGDGGAAQSAMMSSPSAVATGPGGVFYISDTNNQRVRQVASSGIISTLAGTGAAGYSGDGGAPASAQVDFPGGIAVDSSGANIYFADTVNQRIRKVAGGVITTVAGNGTAGYAGNGAAAVNALLNSPVAVAVDSAENLYIADYNNNVVRKVSSAGVISTLAGNGAVGYSGDGGAAISAQLNGPASVAVDTAGNVFIADSGNHSVRKVTPGGFISTYAGNGTLGYSGDGGAATGAQLATPAGVALDAGGNLYIADSGTGTVRLVSAGLILTIAGGGGFGYSGDGGPAVGAQFNSLSGIALDATGNVYLADRGNNAIRFLQLVAPVPSTGVVTNGASNLPGSIAPGEIVTVFGNGIGPQTLTTSTPVNGVIPTEVAGATVYIGGIPAPILYTWTNQASVVVPYEVTPGKAAVTVAYNGQVSLELPVQVTPTAPGLFTMDQSGQGQAVALNENGVVNSTSTPVAEGTVIIVYMTGAGLVDPTVPDGTFANVQPLLPVTATLGGQSVDVQFVTGSYYLTPGIISVYLRVPAGITGPAVPVMVSIGGLSTQSGVTVAVQ